MPLPEGSLYTSHTHLACSGHILTPLYSHCVCVAVEFCWCLISGSDLNIHTPPLAVPEGSIYSAAFAGCPAQTVGISSEARREIIRISWTHPPWQRAENTTPSVTCTSSMISTSMTSISMTSTASIPSSAAKELDGLEFDK